MPDRMAEIIAGKDLERQALHGDRPSNPPYLD